MKKVFLSLIVLSSFASADYYFDLIHTCIKSYYYQSGKLYYVRSDSGLLVNTGALQGTALEVVIFPDFDFNTTSNMCQKTPSNNTLGLSNPDFQYLNSIIGLLIFVMMIMSLL